MFEREQQGKTITIEHIENGYIVNVHRPRVIDEGERFGHMINPVIKMVEKMQSKGEDWKEQEPSVDEQLDEIIKKGPPAHQKFIAKTWVELLKVLDDLNDFHPAKAHKSAQKQH